MASDLFAPQPILLPLGTGAPVFAISPTFSGTVTMANATFTGADIRMAALPTADPATALGRIWTNTNVHTKST